MAPLLIDGPETLGMLYGESFYTFAGDPMLALPVTPVAVEPAVQRPVTRLEPVRTPEVAHTPALEEVQQPLVEPAREVKPPMVETPTMKPGITWRPKPASKVLFVLQLSEFKNAELTEFLKKIVESLGLPTEFVGFGQIDGQVGLEEFDAMPNPHAVVFDTGIWGGKENPVRLGKGEVYFTHRLVDLQNNVDQKRALWVHLKKLKDRLTT